MAHEKKKRRGEKTKERKRNREVGVKEKPKELAGSKRRPRTSTALARSRCVLVTKSRSLAQSNMEELKFEATDDGPAGGHLARRGPGSPVVIGG